MILYATIFAGMLAAIIIGLVNFTKKNTPMFFKLILLGTVTLGLGRLYELVQTLLFNALYSNFHIGKFAMIGGFLFYFTAYYGTMDRVLDDRNPGNAKYRRLALLCPLAVLLVFVGLPVLNGVLFLECAGALAVCLSGLPALYYCFKYMIFPMDGMQMIKKLKLFNLFTIVSILLADAEVLCIVLYASLNVKLYGVIWVLGDFALTVIYVLQMVFLVRGYKKWTV